MPIKSILTFLLLSTQIYAQDNFKLIRFNPPRPSAEAHRATIGVLVSGAAPSLQPSDWSVIASKSNLQISLQVVQADHPSTTSFDLRVDTTPLGEESLGNFKWTIGIPLLPTIAPLHVDANAPDSKSRLFGPAKGKTDADLYFFGSILAGVGTKPLYVIDAKASPAWDLADTGWAFGIKATFSANQSASPPISRSTIDPDSVTGSALFNKGLAHNLSLNLPLAGGQFSRKYPASDFISSGSLSWAPPAYRIGKRLCQTPNCETSDCDSDCKSAKIKHDIARPQVAFSPSIGFEGGKNLNQPHQLFSQPVDLSRWNGIARLTPAVSAGLYLSGSKPTVEIPFPFTFTAIYQPRIPFTLEPFVTTVGTGSSTIQSTLLRKNTRHEVEANANWNFNQYFGLAINYRYGSLPPLFTFVDQQVTLGLTFKTVFKK